MQSINLGMGDTVATLRSEGCENAIAHRIRHAIESGAVERPELDGGQRFRFRTRNLNQLRVYLRNVPKQGRRPRRPELTTS